MRAHTADLSFAADRANPARRFRLSRTTPPGCRGRMAVVWLPCSRGAAARPSRDVGSVKICRYVSFPSGEGLGGNAAPAVLPLLCRSAGEKLPLSPDPNQSVPSSRVRLASFSQSVPPYLIWSVARLVRPAPSASRFPHAICRPRPPAPSVGRSARPNPAAPLDGRFAGRLS